MKGSSLAVVISNCAMTTLLLGCGLLVNPSFVPVPTAGPGNDRCLLARYEGSLVAHPDWGIAVDGGDGTATRVLWPNGYVARTAGDELELLDASGRVLGRTGDEITAGGGLVRIDGIDTFAICPEGIEIRRAASE